MGRKARCGVMHNVADMGWLEIMVLQSGIACVIWNVIWNVRYGEEWWCDVECGVVWNNVRRFSMWNHSCNVKGGGMTCDEVRLRFNGNVLYIPWATSYRPPPHFTSNHISGTAHHTTFHYFSTTRLHITWRDVVYYAVEVGVMWNVLQCQMRDVPYSS